jgi:hypothetical protein
MTKPLDTQRRLLLQAGMLLPVTAVTGISAQAIASSLAIDDPMAESFGYMLVSDKDGQSCANCKYFAGESASGIGRCRLFRANVEAAGWCSNWSL